MLSDLTILTNEIGKELQKNPRIPFQEYQQLVHKDITPELFRKIRLYLETVKNYYKKYYNLASNKKDQIISEMESKDKEGFIKLKEQNLNDQLKEFVTNKNGKNRFVIYRGHIIQKMDPIYLDPSNKFVKAQFYAPRKKVFGYFVHTFWVNIIVIWVMAIILYLILQFRLFKRFLDQMEHWSFKLFPEEE